MTHDHSQASRAWVPEREASHVLTWRGDTTALIQVASAFQDSCSGGTFSILTALGNTAHP